jgi:hypothetical protein
VEFVVVVAADVVSFVNIVVVVSFDNVDVVDDVVVVGGEDVDVELLIFVRRTAKRTKIKI